MDDQGNTIISEDDFFQTYKDGPKKAEKYRKAMKMVNEDVMLKDIIDEVGISRKGLYKWRKWGTKPDSIRGWELALEKDWVPLTYESKQLRSINKIAAWALSGGCILPNWGIILSGKPEDLEKISKEVENLGLKPSIRNPKEQDLGKDRGGPELEIGGEGASPFGRLIHALGIPKGSKAKQIYELPEYIRKAPTEMKKDFLDVYLSNRMILHEGNRGFKTTLERDQEHREGMKKMFKQLNQLTKELTNIKGNIYLDENHINLYFDKGEARKVLDHIDISYNQSKRKKARRKLNI